MDLQLQQDLVAYLDGELASSERAAIEAILHESLEARIFLEELRQDSERIKRLPRARLPVDFCNRIVQRIQGGKSTVEPLRLRIQKWIPIAIAASLLFVISLGTFFLLAKVGRTRPAVPEMAQTQPRSESESQTHSDSEKPRPATSEDPEPAPLPSPNTTAPDEPLAASSEPNQSPSRNDDSTMIEALHPSVPSTNNYETPVLTSPVGNLGQNPFKTLELKLPIFREFRELNRQNLATDLQSENMFYIDLATSDLGRALDRMQVALRNQGVRLQLDGDLRQGVGRGTTPYLMYVENLAFDSLSRVVEHLQSEEKKDKLFGTLLVQGMDGNSRRRWAESLGVPPQSMPNPKAQRSTDSVKPSKPKSEATGFAMLTITKLPRLKTSAEYKLFVDRRSPPIPDHYHLVFLVRPTAR